MNPGHRNRFKVGIFLSLYWGVILFAQTSGADHSEEALARQKEFVQTGYPTPISIESAVDSLNAVLPRVLGESDLVQADEVRSAIWHATYAEKQLNELEGERMLRSLQRDQLPEGCLLSFQLEIHIYPQEKNSDAWKILSRNVYLHVGWDHSLNPKSTWKRHVRIPIRVRFTKLEHSKFGAGQ